jgi:hypothetical protein
VDFINAKSTPIFTVKHFRLLQVLITVGLILSIVGGTSSKVQPDGTIKVDSTSKVGIILYIVAYVGLALVYFASVSRTYCVPGKERRVPVAIVIALPFVLVRLIYSACAVFLHTHLFNIVTGSVVVLALMAIVEEFIVVVIYISLGFAVDKLDASDPGTIAKRPWKVKKSKLNRREGRHQGYRAEAPRSDEQAYREPMQPISVHENGVTR